MKENTLSVIVAAAMGALSAYCMEIIVPVAVMVAAMVLDYLTGMAKAYIQGNLCSKIGLQGIVKKVGYIVLVAVAMLADYVIADGMARLGVTYEIDFLLVAMVLVWLIINECISILENLSAVGVPVPEWLVKIIHKLKVKTEEKTGAEDKGVE